MKHRTYTIATKSITTQVLLGFIFALLAIYVWITPNEDYIEQFGAIERNVLGWKIVLSGLPIVAFFGCVFVAIGRKYPN